MKQKPFHLVDYLLLFLLIGIFFHQVIFLTSSYEPNDTNGMAQIASGGISGTPSSYLVYSNIVLGFLISNSYRLISDFSWYAVFQVLSVLFSCLVFLITFFRFARAKLHIFSYILFANFTFLASAVLLKWNTTSINYSATAFQCSVLGLGSLLLAVNANLRLLAWLASAVAVLGFLWRHDAFFGTLLFFTPLIVADLFNGDCKKKINVWSAFSALLATAFFVNKYMYLRDPAWANYYRFISSSAPLQGNLSFDEIKNSKNFGGTLLKSGMSRESFEMFENWFLDPKIMQVESLKYLGALAERSSVSEIIFKMNSVRTFGSLILTILIAVAFSFFMNARFTVVIPLTVINFFTLSFVKTFLFVDLRLPEYVQTGINLSYLIVLSLSFLLYSSSKSFKKHEERLKKNNWSFGVANLFIALLILVNYGDWRPNKVLAMEQEKFDVSVKALIAEDRPAQFIRPSILSEGYENPFINYSLKDAKVVPSGLIMGSPLHERMLENLGISRSVPLALINGEMLVSGSRTYLVALEKYLFKEYEVCGVFLPYGTTLTPTFLFSKTKCKGFHFRERVKLHGEFSYDEDVNWSLSPDFSFRLSQCDYESGTQKKLSNKTITFDLVSPFGEYATDREVAIEYVDEIGNLQSTNVRLPAFEKKSFSIRTRSCEIGVVSRSEAIIPNRVNPNFTDNRTLYLGVTNYSQIVRFQNIFQF